MQQQGLIHTLTVFTMEQPKSWIPNFKRRWLEGKSWSLLARDHGQHQRRIVQ